MRLMSFNWHHPSWVVVLSCAICLFFSHL